MNNLALGWVGGIFKLEELRSHSLRNVLAEGEKHIAEHAKNPSKFYNMMGRAILARFQQAEREINSMAPGPTSTPELTVRPLLLSLGDYLWVQLHDGLHNLSRQTNRWLRQEVRSHKISSGGNKTELAMKLSWGPDEHEVDIKSSQRRRSRVVGSIKSDLGRGKR